MHMNIPNHIHQDQDPRHILMAREHQEKDREIRRAIATIEANGSMWIQGMKWILMNQGFAADFFVGTPLEGWEPVSFDALERFIDEARKALQEGKALRSPGNDFSITRRPSTIAWPTKIEIKKINREIASLAEKLLRRKGTPMHTSELVSALKSEGWKGIPHIPKETQEVPNQLEQRLYRILQSRPRTFRTRKGSLWGLVEWDIRVNETTS